MLASLLQQARPVMVNVFVRLKKEFISHAFLHPRVVTARKTSMNSLASNSSRFSGHSWVVVLKGENCKSHVTEVCVFHCLICCSL
ncbi:hypothetical protein E2C01_084878 [Portunus trituberculatus]|uniref:Uncharacterized protein n=1 Tax=Portunus trituberculatus TaxID=210409 RepID=A0A5B7J561_PORTR|nr:hypothetical protein [Portunus trituberculatus]